MIKKGKECNCRIRHKTKDHLEIAACVQVW